jgi:hypothetical protein
LSFGPGDSTVSATVGSVVCGTASWTTSTTVRCYAGMSTGGSAQYLTVAGLVGTGTGVLSFDGAQAILLLNFRSAVRCCALLQLR